MKMIYRKLSKTASLPVTRSRFPRSRLDVYSEVGRCQCHASH